MNNKLKAGAAGIAAAAILAGGSTFALWDKTAGVEGGTITNGTLDVSAVAVGQFDTSTDRSDAAAIPGTELTGHVIDLDTWRGAPGDKVAFVYDVDGALQGDNLTANLAVATADGTPLASGNGWSFQYRLYDTAGDEVVAGVDSFNAIRFSSADNTRNVRSIATMPTTLAATGGEYKLVVEGTFDPETADTDEVTDVTDLAALTVSLEQSRLTNGYGGFTGNGPIE